MSGNFEYEVARVLRAGEEPRVEKMQVWSGRRVDTRSERRLRRRRHLKMSNHLGKYSRADASSNVGACYVRYEQPPLGTYGA